MTTSVTIETNTLIIIMLQPAFLLNLHHQITLHGGLNSPEYL